MRILFFSDNFPPETNAPAARTFEHARLWVESGHDVTVVTCVPNFPTGRIHDGYRNLPRTVESVDGIRVVRVWTYVTPNEGRGRRSLDYLSYAVSAVPAALLEERPSVVVGTSPQLLTVLAAWIVSRLRGVPCVFELRDLWPESIVAVGAAPDGLAVKAIAALARFLYRHTDRIVAVTDSFAEILSHRGVPRWKIAVVKNGVDLARFSPGARDGRLRDEIGVGPEAFLITYAGTVGMAHGLSTVLDAAEASAADGLAFLLAGDGAEKERLAREANARGLENVFFLPGQPRARIPGILGTSDAVLIHLRSSPLFASVIPSKVFEAMAMARPIILGGTGESADLVRQAGCGIVVPPENAEEIVRAATRLAADPAFARSLGESGRRVAEERFSRRDSALRMLDVLREVAEARSGPGSP
jgi:colanic acid biosynthesis glycosyl transferase WcaI